MKKKKDSIDSKYHQQLKEFGESDFDRDKASSKLDQKRVRLTLLKSKDFSTLTDLEIEELTTLKLEIPKLESQVDNNDVVNREQNLTKYFLSVGSTLSEYYQALENKSNDLPSFLQITKGEAPTENAVQKISQLYNAKIDPLNHYEVYDTEVTDICPSCFVERDITSVEGLAVCPKCHDSEAFVVHTDKPSYNDSPCDNIYFSYLRINHFREKLAKIQQKDNFKIPRGIEEKLCEMFHKIQEPFIKHCPADKTNFTSYNYVINKCLHIIKHPEYAKHFPLLKSKDNLYKADMIWKKICAELKLPFIPSN